MARFPAFSSSFNSGFSQSLLASEYDDVDEPAAPKLGRSLLTAPVGPKRENRADDLSRVASLLTKTSDLINDPASDRAREGTSGRHASVAPAFGMPLETSIRSFQTRRGLKADGLLNPGGPTETALKRQADQLTGVAKEPKRPALKGLDGAAMAENGRTVSFLKSTGSDGIMPDLLAETARQSRSGRSQVADFFAQLKRSDHERAEQIRKKMGLDDREDRLLFNEVERVLEAESLDQAKQRLSAIPSPRSDDNNDDGGIGDPPDGGDEPPADGNPEGTPNDDDKPDGSREPKRRSIHVPLAG